MIDDRPRISADDVKALLGLIVLFAIIIAICAVDPSDLAAAR